MDEERLHQLLHKPWVGKRIADFWRAHGFQNESDLAQKIEALFGDKFTNAARIEDGVVPQWPNLIKILHACNSDLREFINFIDPAPSEFIDGIEIPQRHRPLFVMLSTILKNSEAAGNERRITGISVNLEDISAAANAEKAVAPAVNGGIKTDEQAVATKKQIARFTKKKKKRMRPARDRPAVMEGKQRRPSH